MKTDMKYTLYTLAALGMLALSVSCAKEVAQADEIGSTAENSDVLQVELNVPETGSKTVLGAKNGSTYPVYWKSGDVISLNGVECTSMNIATGGASATASFKLSALSAPFNFLYKGVSGSSTQVVFPSSQTYASGTFDAAAMPMYASVSTLSNGVTFSHLASLLRFSFTGEGKLDAINLVAEDASKSLSGAFTIGTTASGLLNGSLTPTVAGNGLSYSFPGHLTLSETPQIVYIAIPAGVYAGGITLTLVDNQAGNMTIHVLESSSTVAAGKVIEFSNVTYVADASVKEVLKIWNTTTLETFRSRVAAGEKTLDAQVTAASAIDASSMNWTPIDGYRGTFDGAGKTISGLKAPLFNDLQGVVKNLTLNSNISLNSDQSSLGIFANSVTPCSEIDDIAGLQNCTAKGSLTFTPPAATSGNRQIGGLVGNLNGGALSGCTNEATVTVASNGQDNASQLSVGGVVARSQKGGELSTNCDISGCTNSGTVTVNMALTDNLYLGGVIGYEVSGSDMVSSCTNAGTVQVGSSFYTAKAFHLGGVIGLAGGLVENCSNAASGIVTSVEGSAAGTYICQGGAIGRINVSKSYSGISNYGTVNVAINGAPIHAGGVLGRNNEGAVITDFVNGGDVLCSSNGTSSAFIGGVVASAESKALSSCSSTGGSVRFTGTNPAGNLYVGGVVGYATQEVSDCSNAAAVEVGGTFSPVGNSFYATGGVIGSQSSDAALTNCTNSGAVTYNGNISDKGYTYLGGMAGRSAGPIVGGGNSGTVTFAGRSAAQNPMIGGVVGTTVSPSEGGSQDRIVDAVNSGSVVIDTPIQTTKNFYVGGVAGRLLSGNHRATNRGTLNVNTLTCTRLYLGGVAGLNDNGTILSGTVNEEAGDIFVSGLTTIKEKEKDTPATWIAGVVGHNDGALTGAFNAGDVTVGSSLSLGDMIRVAGVAAQATRTAVSNCSNSGNISNASATPTNKDIQMGGVFGKNEVDASDCSNSGTITNTGASGWDVCLGGVTGNNGGKTLTACYNTGTVTNNGTGSILAIGGVAGWSGANSVYASACYNTGAISNTGVASNNLAGVRMGGVVGSTDGLNTLTGTASSYCYNDGTITENSESSYLAVGGVVGFSDNSGNDMAYAKNKGNGDITLSNLHYNSYIGGILGMAQAVCTMDYADNAGDLNFDDVTVSHQIWIGGVLGGFNASNSDTKNAEVEINYCTNSGNINCPNRDGNGGNMKAASQNVTAYSYIGGISGTGDNFYKSFLNCSNTGNISFYNQFKVRLGGVCAYSNVNPTGSSCEARITYYRYDPMDIKSKDTSGSYGDVGGVVGYMNIPTVSELSFYGRLQTTGSSPNCYTGGIVGHVGDNTNCFSDCYIQSDNVVGVGAKKFGNTAAGLFAADGKANAWSFPGCYIATGSYCQTILVSEDKFGDMLIGRNKATSITDAPEIIDFD